MNKLFVLVLALCALSLLFSGCVNAIDECADQDSPAPGSQVDFNAIVCSDKPECLPTYFCPSIDPGFSEGEVQNIRRALEDWNVSSLGYARFDSGSSDTCTKFQILKNNADWFAGPQGPGISAAKGYTDSDVHVNKDKVCGSRMFNHVVRHELGHILGLEHSTNSSAMMYPKDFPGDALTPQTEDVKNYFIRQDCCPKK